MKFSRLNKSDGPDGKHPTSYHLVFLASINCNILLAVGKVCVGATLTGTQGTKLTISFCNIFTLQPDMSEIYLQENGLAAHI